MSDSLRYDTQISVIIPLYNKAPYIKRALDSVLAQTVQNFEIVVVNDGSTDGSEKIVAGMNDSRIRLINQENQGVSVARNNGVNVAHADLVAFLDADDEWLPEFLETILELRIRYPNAGIYSTGKYLSQIINGIITVTPYKSYNPTGSSDSIIPSAFRYAIHTGGFPANASTVAIPKKIFNTIGGFRKGVWAGEDSDLWGRIALKHSTAHSFKSMAIIHREKCCSVTDNYDKLSNLTSHPFCDSIFELSKSDVILKQQLETDYYLIAFLEMLNLDLAAWKILSHSSIEKRNGRKCLKKVHLKIYQMKKILLYLLSYLPTGYALCLLSISNSIPLLNRIKNRLY